MKNIIETIFDLFIVRRDCYPKQLENLNEYIVVKENLTPSILQKHLKGEITIGCWQIDPETNKVKWICFDYDGELNEELEKAKILCKKLKEKGYHPLLEFSGRRGYHVWLFVKPIDAGIARKFAHDISNDCKPHEIFPKQDKIDKDGFGGQVKLPLGIHRVNNTRSRLFNVDLEILDEEEGGRRLIRISQNLRDSIKNRNLVFFIEK